MFYTHAIIQTFDGEGDLYDYRDLPRNPWHPIYWRLTRIIKSLHKALIIKRNNRGSFPRPFAEEDALTLIHQWAILIFWVQVT